MSGAPVFANGALAFPLVGLISEFSTDFRIAVRQARLNSNRGAHRSA
jgi:hypothetical protein